jgi:hypothetical protein
MQDRQLSSDRIGSAPSSLRPARARARPLLPPLAPPLLISLRTCRLPRCPLYFIGGGVLGRGSRRCSRWGSYRQRTPPSLLPLPTVSCGGPSQITAQLRATCSESPYYTAPSRLPSTPPPDPPGAGVPLARALTTGVSSTHVEHQTPPRARLLPAPSRGALAARGVRLSDALHHARAQRGNRMNPIQRPSIGQDVGGAVSGAGFDGRDG